MNERFWNGTYWLMLALVAIAILLVYCTASAADLNVKCEPGAFGCGHEEQHQQYKSWRMGAPMYSYSCCSSKDCRPGRAMVMYDRWHIYIPEYKQWIPVPSNKIDEPDIMKDGRSHFCTADPINWVNTGNPQTTLPIHCFSPAKIKG